MLTLANYINGKFIGPSTKGYLDSWNPATGEIFAQVPASDANDVGLAVKVAKEAFGKWSKTPAQERANIMCRIADILERRLEEFARAESQDQGKPVWLAREVDIPRAIKNFRFFAGAILHHKESAMDMDGAALNYTQRVPIGVAGLIAPWNLPLYLITWKIAPAMAVGNTCVAKPSELTSVTAWMLCEVFSEAKVPAGVVNMVFGLGEEAGDAIVRHKDVPLLSFTGGSATGAAILEATAPLHKKIGLEMGGKNPNIIFDDADLDQCVPTTIRSSFQNQGEVCLCGERVFVQEGIYDKFMDRFVEETKKLRVGDPLDEKSFMGPIVSPEHMKKIQYYIDVAVQEGGEILCGGDRPKLPSQFDKGWFLNPTIIANLHNNCRSMQEENFGPVVGIAKFKHEDDVIRWSNDSPFGLSASLWTTNLSRAHRVAQQINAGYVWINSWVLRDLRAPFGGMKASGLGREGGEHSIDFYTELKTICIKL